LLGRARVELVGTPLKAILPLATRIFFDAHLWPRLALHGWVDDLYISLLGAGGRPLPVLLTATRGARGGLLRTECDFVVIRRRPFLDVSSS
jgi:phosphoserine phosphatase RsbU/P